MESVTFGAFELSYTKRVLLRDGEPVPVGSRAMGILVALTENAGAILSNRELLRRVWPDTVVEEGTIRVHVAQLRKIFRDVDPHGDYVQNVTGRGYRFAAPVLSRRSELPDSPSLPDAPVRRMCQKYDLPHRLTPLIGCSRSIDTLVEKVQSQRWVTVVGPGGGGKTSLAVSVADTLSDMHPERWPDGIRFVDLASAADARRAPRVLASALGITSIADDPLPDILAYLSERSMLLLLDNCEHVLEVIAKLGERVLQQAPNVNVLATSREPLRAAGESIYDVQALEFPPEQGAKTRARWLEYPTVRLFVERANAHANTELSDDDMARIAEICRRLAGNPLAIEIAAAHVRLLGVKALAATLRDDLYLLIAGRRTAEPRHRTLQANFDWSYDLLSPVEQSVFGRLSVFADSFDLDDAASALVDEMLAYATLFECLVNLVRKSLLVADTTGEKVRYRLLDLPRAYAREKLRRADEHRHRLPERVKEVCHRG